MSPNSHNSHNFQGSGNLPEFRTGPLITGAALVGAGTMVALVGLAVGGSHLLSATRRWMQAMEVPPSEMARLKWVQAMDGRRGRHGRLAERRAGRRQFLTIGCRFTRGCRFNSRVPDDSADTPVQDVRMGPQPAAAAH